MDYIKSPKATDNIARRWGIDIFCCDKMDVANGD